MSDKRKLYVISISTLSALLLIFLIPFDTAGRILTATAIAVAAVICYLFIKKRPILSMNKNQVLIVLTSIALVYLMLYYLSGLNFGFYKNPYALNLEFFLTFFIPTAVVITASEVFRYVMRAQEDRIADMLCFLSCVVAEITICSTATVGMSSFSNFMDLVGETFFPAVMANLLYHYLTKRYGFYPNIIYRAITTLYIYIIPYTSAMSDAIHIFIKLMLPIAIFLFIDSLFEKKRRYALAKKSRLEKPITIIAVTIMLVVLMLISNQFQYGMYVIATDSMTGEINKGDAAIYERYDDQTIIEGQVIAYREGKSVIIHRVDDIQIINGTTRYYTKGDANGDRDTGYRTDGDIVGLVNFKIPYIGYPTIWLRSLFSH
jgi:signal peptidase